MLLVVGKLNASNVEFMTDRLDACLEDEDEEPGV